MNQNMCYRGMTLLLIIAMLSMNISIQKDVVYAADPVSTVFYYLTQDLGLNEAAACGILANIEQESAFNPSLSVLDTNGKYTLGICQWNGGRKSKLELFAGSEAYTIEGQLKYLKYELFSSEYNAWCKMNLQSVPNTVDGAGKAAQRWATYFERCAAYYCPVTNNGYMNLHCAECRYQYGERISLAQSKYWYLYGAGQSSNAKDALSKKDDKSKADQNKKNGSIDMKSLDDATVSDAPMVYTNKDCYRHGLPVEVIFDGVSKKDTNTLEVWCNDELVLHENMKETSYVLEDLPEGKYTAILMVDSKKNGLEISDPWIFNVQRKIVGKPSLCSDQIVFNYNEPLSLRRNFIAYTDYYQIIIERDGKELVNQEMTSTIYELKHPIAGHYVAYLKVGNQVTGEITSKAFEFDVEDHEHNWDSCMVKKEPTCSEAGTLLYTCSCLKTYEDIIPAKGHTFENHVCTVCGEAE